VKVSISIHSPTTEYKTTATKIANFKQASIHVFVCLLALDYQNDNCYQLPFPQIELLNP